jgi:hypothetical protein
MLDTLSVHHSPEWPAIHLARWSARGWSVGSRIAPLAIMEGTARHGTRQGRLRRPSGISDLDPHRTEPQIASYRAMREVCPCP